MDRRPLTTGEIDRLVSGIRADLREWTDATQHDPGIALLELLAYLGDTLSFYAERIANDSYLGGTGRRGALARTNVTLPASLLAEVDRYAGPRGRSRYVAEAVAQRVRRDALGAAIRETAGAMVSQPGWMSPDEVAAWVEELRSEETD